MDQVSRHDLWSKFGFDSAINSRIEPASRDVNNMPYGPSVCDYQVAKSMALLACDLELP